MLLTENTEAKVEIDRLIPVSPAELKATVCGLLTEEWWLHQFDPEFEEMWENGHPAVAINVSIGDEHVVSEWSNWPSLLMGLQHMLRERGFSVEVITDRLDTGYISYLVIICARHL